MKKQFIGFIAGVLTAGLVGTLTMSAFAITERMNITVDPINVQVNGETFQPKDVNGKDVPVFVYEGTTYAPLRALAEAYGLEVWYDSEKNMATVVDPNFIPATQDFTASYDYSDWSTDKESAYQDFKEIWEFEVSDTKRSVVADVKSGIQVEMFISFLKTHDSEMNDFGNRMIAELHDEYADPEQNFYVAFATYGVVAWGGWYWIDFENSITHSYDSQGYYKTIEEAIEDIKDTPYYHD